MKVFVYPDEFWPVYIIVDDYDTEVEISDDLYARYQTYLRGWNEVQDELEALYKAAGEGAEA